jgi:acyl-CoA thioester hydrolase
MEEVFASVAGETPGPAAFEMAVGVAAEDIDRLGHVNNTVYLRWVQEVAVAHWRMLATPQQQQEIVWLVLRHEIDYKQPALLGNQIILRTWVGRAEGLRFERLTQVLRSPDRILLAHARTLWCPVDAQTGRPKRLPTELRRLVSWEPD